MDHGFRRMGAAPWGHRVAGRCVYSSGLHSRLGAPLAFGTRTREGARGRSRLSTGQAISGPSRDEMSLAKESS
jgi:hypothetical protein